MASLTADADLCSQLDNLSVQDLHDISTATPNSDAVSSLYDHYTTVTTDSSSSSGILQIFDLFYLKISVLTDVAKLDMLSDGLCNDVLLLSLSELGLNASKPQPMGYFPLKVRSIIILFL